MSDDPYPWHVDQSGNFHFGTPADLAKHVSDQSRRRDEITREVQTRREGIAADREQKDRGRD